MNEIITVENLIEQVRNLIRFQGKVFYDTPIYEKFHKEVTEYVHSIYFDNTEEWTLIQKNLIWKPSQYLTTKEAEDILTGLENIRLKILERINGYKEPFWEYIHPIITSISQKKFVEKHFSDSIESAFKEVNTIIQKLYYKLTGETKDGADLMHSAFSDKGYPNIIQFLDSNNNYVKGNQEAYMELFAGAYRTSRNPFAHANLTIEKNEAIRYLMLASMLMYKIDDAVRLNDKLK